MARSCCFCLLMSSSYVCMTAHRGAIGGLHCKATTGAVWLRFTSLFYLCNELQMALHNQQLSLDQHLCKAGSLFWHAHNMWLPTFLLHDPDLPMCSESLEQLEAQAMQHMQQLPMDKQLHMAEGFRKFMDHMSGQIKAKAQASGEQSYTVTEADVHEMVAGLQEAK